MSQKIKTFKHYLWPLSFLLLASCAYTQEGSLQDIYFETPGAENSLCYVYVDKFRYKAIPPETITIPRSEEDLIVDCLAPGNRRKEIVVEPRIADSADYNALSLGAGYAWDHLSEALYVYPSTVSVNFKGVPVKSNDLPDYNNLDVKQPEEYDLEEYLPGSPQLNADKNRKATTIKPRQAPQYDSSDFFFQSQQYRPSAPVTEIAPPSASESNIIPGTSPSGDASGASAPISPSGSAVEESGSLDTIIDGLNEGDGNSPAAEAAPTNPSASTPGTNAESGDDLGAPPSGNEAVPVQPGL